MKKYSNLVVSVVALIFIMYLFISMNGNQASAPTNNNMVNPTGSGSYTSEVSVKEESPSLESVTTSSGLMIQDLQIGAGEAVKSGDTIKMHYLGTLMDGTKFDSSYDRGEPFQTQIGVGQVIKGWDEGVVGMKVGGKRKLTIPASLAYGDRDLGSIPPNSTLVFELELVEIL